MLASTVSPLELVWTLIAACAIGFTAWTVRDNWLNLQAIRQAVRLHRAVTWGPRYWVAFASLVSSVVMVVVWLGFAVIGIAAMSVSPETDPARRMAVSEWSGWALIAMTLLLASVQVWQLYARSKIRAPHRSMSADDEALAQAQYAESGDGQRRPATTAVREADAIAAETATVATAAAQTEVATIAAADAAADASMTAHAVADAAAKSADLAADLADASERERDREGSA